MEIKNAKPNAARWKCATATSWLNLPVAVVHATHVALNNKKTFIKLKKNKVCAVVVAVVVVVVVVGVGQGVAKAAPPIERFMAGRAKN